MLLAHRLARSEAEIQQGTNGANVATEHVAVRERYPFKILASFPVHYIHLCDLGGAGTCGSLAVASTGNSPRSANQSPCDRLPFSRQLRRLIALQGLARLRELREATVGIWRKEHRYDTRGGTRASQKDTYHFPCRRRAHYRTSPTTRLPGDGGRQRRNRSHGAPPTVANGSSCVTNSTVPVGLSHSNSKPSAYTNRIDPV